MTNLKIMEWHFRIPLLLALCHQSIQQYHTGAIGDKNTPTFHSMPLPHPPFHHHPQSPHTLFKHQVYQTNIIQPIPQPMPKQEAPVEPARSSEQPTNPGSDPAEKNPQIWRFEVDVPEIVKNIRNYFVGDIANSSSVNGETKHILRQNTIKIPGGGEWAMKKLKFEVVRPKLEDIIKSVTDALLAKRSRRDYHPVKYGYVEEGPGSIKSESHNKYPEGYQQGRLNNLVVLKRKRDKAHAMAHG